MSEVSSFLPDAFARPLLDDGDGHTAAHDAFAEGVVFHRR